MVRDHISLDLVLAVMSAVARDVVFYVLNIRMRPVLAPLLILWLFHSTSPCSLVLMLGLLLHFFLAKWNLDESFVEFFESLGLHGFDRLLYQLLRHWFVLLLHGGLVLQVELHVMNLVE